MTIKDKPLSEVMGVEAINAHLPKYVEADLLACFSQSPHTGHSNDLEKWFTVWCDRTELYLSQIIPLATAGMPVYNLCDRFLIWFDWNIQKFIVSA